jgi:transketolase
MRSAFAQALVELAARDARVVLLTGDLGFAVLEPFAERFPRRFYNVGVAEQNMLGLATGLADAGFVPFVYSIATFASMRPYEFIRNGPVLHQLPVRIVGVGGGVEYGHNGPTHYALEDVALMRAQPELVIVAPADAEQARGAVAATRDHPGPLYLRLSKQPGAIPELDGRFELGRAVLIGDGVDLAIVALGPAAREALEAERSLREAGISASVAVVSSFNPSPDADLVEILGQVPLAVTVESHYVSGGVGSYVCEVVAENKLPCRVVRCAVRRVPRGETGGHEYLQERLGISAPAVVEAALQSLRLQPT